MKKFSASLLLAAGIAAVSFAAPASAAPIITDSSTNVVSPFSYWPKP